MAPHTLRYPLGEGDSIEAVQTALVSKFRCAGEPEAVQRATLYDSFDWRLHGAGLQLDEVKGEGVHNLVLRALDSAAPFETIRLGSEPPRFAWMTRGDFESRRKNNRRRGHEQDPAAVADARRGDSGRDETPSAI